MRRVFDGGEGLIRGGTAERSRDIGVPVPRDSGLEGDEVGGEVEVGAIASKSSQRMIITMAQWVDLDTENALGLQVAMVPTLKYSV
ncbi:MAG: hypothetical protein LQ347_007032 [Umbilicaria vellea]|nr:MAG: hypothetical protein LQ347_007032 [Umbilicaria vellea]